MTDEKESRETGARQEQIPSGSNPAGEGEREGAVENEKNGSLGAEPDGGGESSHRMVETDRQPGLMQHPFATHAPPPAEEEDGDESAWKGGAMGSLIDGDKISTPFVLGMLIVAAALFVGLMFASQRRQLGELRERIEVIERHIDPVDDE